MSDEMSDEITVKTNYHRRDILNEWELTPKERLEFDYLDWKAFEQGRDSASFFRYRGQVYDLGEFGIAPPSLRGKWDNFQSDSYFSGILVRYSDNYESVIVGLLLA
jgi:hypothetical protein